MRQAEPHVGMFPRASACGWGGLGTWANTTKKQAGMNQGQLKYAEMQLLPLGKNNPKQSYVIYGRDLKGGMRLLLRCMQVCMNGGGVVWAGSEPLS